VLAWVSERISADLRNTTYAHLQKLSLDYFGTKRTGDLVARISSDTDRICSFLSDTLVDFIADVLMIVGTAVVLISIDPILAAATLCTFPIIAWLTVHLRDRMTHGFLHGGRAWDEMTSLLADTIPGIRVVKAFAQEKREIERFRAANLRIIAANDRVNRVWTFFWPAVALLTQIGLLVVWVVGAWQVFSGRVTVGVLVAFLAYIGRFYARLESMSRMVTSTQKAAASSQRLFEILDRPPGVPEPAHPVHPDKIRGAIEVRNASFRFGSRQVIDGVSLDVKPGEMIGLVGTTGAGKSTLVNLVCRFYDVSEGAVLVDGTDIRSFPIAEYRRTSASCCRTLSFSGAASRKTSPTANPTPRAPRSWPRRGPRGRMNSSCSSPTATIPWWASAATPCRAASASASPSRAPCSSTRASSSSTRRPRRWTRKPNARSRRRSTTWCAAAPPSRLRTD
jgi:ATP-binding cassette subfamily B protein